MGRKMLPIGYDDFGKIRFDDFYYVDKTGLIKELLENRAEVTLFTRPRRFGKSLNMSMLSYFFSLDGDKSIFEGLEISKETKLCERYMGKYPVIAISLKYAEGKDDQGARSKMKWVIGTEALRFRFLAESDALSAEEKEMYRQLIRVDADGEGVFSMSDNTLSLSLRILCDLLKKHYGTKVVLLIDEYDVPLASAFRNGYYDDMVSLIRDMFGAALKTNDSLELAVLTGCLRISKESIFTGMNNLKVYSVTDALFSEYFGFTSREVREILDYYRLGNRYATVQDWYDGYRFGHEDIYCPWDVINYCSDIQHDPGLSPQNYWIDTSGNNVIKRFVAQATDAMREEIERLIAGEEIEKEIRLDLTYSEMYDSIENLWSLLFMTGYLTQRGETDGKRRKIAIPNQEVRDIFVTQIREYFKESVKADKGTLERLFDQYLERSISIRDAAAPDYRKESFYHGAMLDVLMADGRMGVVSNREAGGGFADILAKSEDGETGIVIEMKYAGDGDLDAACRDAIGQIDERRYTDAFKYTRVRKVLKYGVGCYKKTCRVVLG